MRETIVGLAQSELDPSQELRVLETAVLLNH